MIFPKRCKQTINSLIENVFGNKQCLKVYFVCMLSIFIFFRLYHVMLSEKKNNYFYLTPFVNFFDFFFFKFIQGKNKFVNFVSWQDVIRHSKIHLEFLLGNTIITLSRFIKLTFHYLSMQKKEILFNRQTRSMFNWRFLIDYIRSEHVWSENLISVYIRKSSRYYQHFPLVLTRHDILIMTSVFTLQNHDKCRLTCCVIFIRGRMLWPNKITYVVT